MFQENISYLEFDHALNSMPSQAILAIFLIRDNSNIQMCV